MSRDAFNKVAVETGSGYDIVAMSITTSCVPSVPPKSAPPNVMSSPMLYAVPPFATVMLVIVPLLSVVTSNRAPLALVPAMDLTGTSVNVVLGVYAVAV